MGKYGTLVILLHFEQQYMTVITTLKNYKVALTKKLLSFRKNEYSYLVKTTVMLAGMGHNSKAFGSVFITFTPL